jgi:hypothetical protein
MLILIKGAAGTGKSTLAGRLTSSLGLAPVAWPIADDEMSYGQRLTGEWLDLGRYFGDCRHLDMERVITLLHIVKRDELPPPPAWRPGADRRELLAWRSRVLGEIDNGRLLPALMELTFRLIDATEHAVVEGEVLGSSLTDSLVTRQLLAHYVGVPNLRLLLLQRPPGGGPGSERVALVNGRALHHDEVVGALRRLPDGSIAVSPEVGLTWTGRAAAAAPGGGRPVVAGGPPNALQESRPA